MLLDLWENKILRIVTSPWLWIGLAVIAALIAGYVALNIVHNRRRRKRKMKKMNRFRL